MLNRMSYKNNKTFPRKKRQIYLHVKSCFLHICIPLFWVKRRSISSNNNNTIKKYLTKHIYPEIYQKKSTRWSNIYVPFQWLASRTYIHTINTPYYCKNMLMMMIVLKEKQHVGVEFCKTRTTHNTGSGTLQ